MKNIKEHINKLRKQFEKNSISDAKTTRLSAENLSIDEIIELIIWSEIQKKEQDRW